MRNRGWGRDGVIGCPERDLGGERSGPPSQMTVALSVKVNEGLVLAADSASTVIQQAPGGGAAVVNVYNNANKIFNLRKGLPIGAMTWGSGSIGDCSISMLMKDLRKLFTDDTDQHIDRHNYQIVDVANHVRDFIFNKHYMEAFGSGEFKPDLGITVAGYSVDGVQGEEYQIDMTSGNLAGPRLLREPSQSGATWNGQFEAITRLLIGFSPVLPSLVKDHLNLSDEQTSELIAAISPAMNPQFFQPVMPLQDAIDLAEYLVDVAIKFSQFSPGAPVVGGPIEIAAISRHEGFKWISRKHYYGQELNPEHHHRWEIT